MGIITGGGGVVIWADAIPWSNVEIGSSMQLVNKHHMLYIPWCIHRLPTELEEAVFIYEINAPISSEQYSTIICNVK